MVDCETLIIIDQFHIKTYHLILPSTIIYHLLSHLIEMEEGSNLMLLYMKDIYALGFEREEMR